MSYEQARLKAGIPTYSAARTMAWTYIKGNGYLRHPSEVSHQSKRVRAWGPHRYKLDRFKNYLKTNLWPWRNLSIEKRCATIHLEKGIYVCSDTLLRWYRRNRCSYVKPGYHITNSYSQEQMLKLQQEFSIRVMTLWDRGCELIFIDECTCNPWNKSIRMWMDKDKPFYLDLAPTRKDESGSVAVLGAISNLQKGFKWVVSHERNQESVFKQLINKVIGFPIDPHKTFIIMDQASYHTCNNSIYPFLENGMGVIFLPASSSNLNPIGKYYIQTTQWYLLFNYVYSAYSPLNLY